MACAIVFDDMLARGEVRSYRELATIGRESVARVSQIMNLLHLAPQIREALLAGDVDVRERELRAVVASVDWTAQRTLLGSSKSPQA